MKKYLRIYSIILSTTLKKILEYRVNALVQSLYSFMYLILLYVVIQTMFSQTQSLGGWSKNEVLMTFAVVSILLNILIFTVFEGLRGFMQTGVKNGEIDQVLTKPLAPLFGVSFFKPDISTLVPTVAMILYAIGLGVELREQITLTRFFLFMLTFTFSVVISYLSYTIYAALAFFVEKSSQTMELITKMSDYSQYPVTIFPKSFQFISFTLLPIAFFGYVPTAFLLGKGSVELFVVTIIILISFSVITHFAWKIGLRHYSSVSS